MKVSTIIAHMSTTKEALCPDKSSFLGLLAPLLLLVCNFSCSNTPERPGEDLRSISTETALEAYYTGKIEEAIRELEILLEMHEDGVFIKRQLAVLYREMGERRQDVKVLEELAEGDSNEPDGPYPGDAWFELFAAYYLSGNTKKAVAIRDKTFESIREAGERERADFLFFDAMINKEEGENEQAVTLFRESLALNRYRPIAWFSLGELL